MSAAWDEVILEVKDLRTYFISAYDSVAVLTACFITARGEPVEP